MCVGSDTPTLLKLKTMKGADGKPLKIVQKPIPVHDYTTFGMCLLCTSYNIMHSNMEHNCHFCHHAVKYFNKALMQFLRCNQKACQTKFLSVCVKLTRQVKLISKKDLPVCR